MPKSRTFTDELASGRYLREPLHPAEAPAKPSTFADAFVAMSPSS